MVMFPWLCFMSYARSTWQFILNRPFHDKQSLQTRVGKLIEKLACVEDTTTVGKNVESWQLTFSYRSHVKDEFTNTKKLVKKLARIETSSICRHQFPNMFANCLSCEGRLRESKTRNLKLLTSRLRKFAFDQPTLTFLFLFLMTMKITTLSFKKAYGRT